MRWALTPDEFVHVWSETKLDRYPAPLSIFETASTVDEAAQLRAAARRRFPAAADPDLSVALRVAARPATRVQVIVEGAAAARISVGVVNATAAVCVQRSGRVEIELMAEHKVAATVVAALPGVPAGAGRRLSVSAAELSGPVPVLAAAEYRSPAGDVRKRLRAKRTGTGHVGVERRLDRAHPAPAVYFSWIDVAGDGRYVIRGGRDVDIEPVSPDALRAELGRLLATR